VVKVVGLTRERLSLLETKSGEEKSFLCWRRRVAFQLTGFAAKPKQGRGEATRKGRGRGVVEKAPCLH
jgi:hypothetical protein